MIITEFYKERNDGIKLYKTYSDNLVYIKKYGSDEKYAEAIDIEGAPYEYYETDELILTEEDFDFYFLD